MQHLKQTKRLLIKLSGELLAGGQGHGFDPETFEKVIQQVVALKKANYRLAIVVGGGNFHRGSRGIEAIRKSDSDAIGMLATCMNGIALHSALCNHGVGSYLTNSKPCEYGGRVFQAQNARVALESGDIVICAGGLGSPYFSTDTAAVVRALELQCDLLVKLTKVDGVYDKDPYQYPDATRYDDLTYQEAITKQLRVMDGTAFTLAEEKGLPIVVTSFYQEEPLVNLLKGKCVYSFIG